MDLKLIRITTPVGVDTMTPYLLDGDPKVSRAQLGASLKAQLEHDPRSLFFVVALSQEPTEVQGFIIALAPQNQDFIFMLQVWAKPENSNYVSNRCLFPVLRWAKDLGRSQLRCETKRSSKAFYRRWGFVEFSQILALDIPADWENELIERMER